MAFVKVAAAMAMEKAAPTETMKAAAKARAKIIVTATMMVSWGTPVMKPPIAATDFAWVTPIPDRVSAPKCVPLTLTVIPSDLT